MKRVLLILLMFFLIFIQVQNKTVYGQCAGEGNYCIGHVVQQFGVGCYPDYQAHSCYTNWTDVLSLTCDKTCSVIAGSRGGWTKCTSSSTYSSCVGENYNNVPLSCCFYGGGGGTGGGETCGTTAPSNLAVNCNYSPTEIEFSWTSGSGGVQQGIGAADNVFSVSHPINCNPTLGTPCVFVEILPATFSSWTVQKNRLIGNRRDLPPAVALLEG